MLEDDMQASWFVVCGRACMHSSNFYAQAGDKLKGKPEYKNGEPYKMLHIAEKHFLAWFKSFFPLEKETLLS